MPCGDALANDFIYFVFSFLFESFIFTIFLLGALPQNEMEPTGWEHTPTQTTNRFAVRFKTEFHRHDGGRAAVGFGYPSACFRGSGCTPHFPSGARPKSMTALVSRLPYSSHRLAACSAILRGYTSTSRHQGLPIPVNHR